METVDTKQVDDEINKLETVLINYKYYVEITETKLLNLKERKKSIELYNKK